MRLLLLLVIGSRLVVGAEDARLARIRALLVPMRADVPFNNKVRGASPALTTVKHELRDWIESRIPALKWDGRRWNPDPIVLQEQLNDELSRAELFCEPPLKGRCREWSGLGSVGRVILDVQHGLLVVRTGVGIQECGHDESAYVYESVDGKWVRRWQSEQDDYREDKYQPQWLRQVLISPSDYSPGTDRSEHLILTLGAHPGCASTWHDVYYRVWQTKSGYNEPRLLLDGKEMGAVADDILGSADRAAVLFEYTAEGIEPGFPRRQIHRYVLDRDKLTRVDPVALSPHDFVAYWLTHHSPEVTERTAQESRPALEQWLQTNKGPFAEFAYPTFHCSAQKDLWQVGTNTGEDEKGRAYFLVRWMPPYRFTMVSARDRPWVDCTELDREADEQRSLFPVR